MRKAAEAEAKADGQRSQLERRCLDFAMQMRRAQGEAGLRIHTAIADAAGITATRPRSTVTRTRLTGVTLLPDGRPDLTTGEVVDATVEVKEVPPDWRASKAIAGYRFPEEMGDAEPPEPEVPVDSITRQAMLSASPRSASSVRSGAWTPSKRPPRWSRRVKR